MTLLEVRLILVPEMAAIAASRRTAEHLEELRKVAHEPHGLSVLERDMMVHHVIARASGNILYLILLNFFNRFFVEFGHLYFDVEENAHRSARFHGTSTRPSGAPMRAWRGRSCMTCWPTPNRPSGHT
jgi:DNA-binding FadR family transcriptional regulator